MSKKAHLVQALRWASETEVELLEVLAAGFGMAGPVLLAIIVGQLPLGLVAAIGSWAVSGVGAAADVRTQAKDLILTLAPAAMAAILVTLCAGHGRLTDLMLIGVVGVAALVGSYSLFLVGASVRFVLFFTIISHIADVASGHGLFLLLMAGGACWTFIVNLLLGALIRAYRRIDPLTGHTAPPSSASALRKFARWKHSLGRLSGWQFTLRLIICLGIAAGLQWRWPMHHLYWVTLTIVILTERQVAIFPIKTTQRVLGTALGVFAASILLKYSPSVWRLAIFIGLLGGILPLLKVRNYLAYSAVITPLIILIMDAGQPPEIGMLADRLVATLIGAALVISVNAIFGWLTAKRA
jgi:hypothetical protein